MDGEPSMDGFVPEWEKVRSLAGARTREQVARLVADHAEMLSAIFYDAMFADPHAAPLLDHSVVNERLHASMRRWLVQLFDQTVDPAALARTQRTTGEVHARIGVSVALVSRGARVLTRALFERLAPSRLSRPALIEAAQYVHEMFALAIDTMNSAYSANANRLARSEEAYRLFFLGQDMKAERERRRSELLEWAHQILDRYYWDERSDTTAKEEHSQFALWLQHKAAMLFDGAPEVDLIREDMERVETVLLPQLSRVRASHADARTVVSEINRCIDHIKELLGTMFDRYLAVEDGRDSVTALLNRRYFPAIARREIEVATAQKSQFAVLMIDIDSFRHVADNWGFDAGNQLLSRAALLLQDHLRAGDFVFRVGEDEFLVLLVESSPTAAVRVAEGLRKRFEAAQITLGPGQATSVTVSVGVAVFDGHPDYQRLLDRADTALRRAKSEGRNRCVIET